MTLVLDLESESPSSFTPSDVGSTLTPPPRGDAPTITESVSPAGVATVKGNKTWSSI